MFIQSHQKKEDKSNWISSKCKSFLLFYTKILLFLFYILIFIKHSQSIYSTHLFNKIFILLKIFIISSLTTPLSLSLSLSLSHTQYYQKNTIIFYARTTVTMHIYTITIVLVHLCTILHSLIWVFFFFFISKCAYLNTFSILHYFSLTNASALMFINYKDPAKSKSSKFPLVLSNFFNCFAGQSYRVNHGQLLYSSALYYIYYQVPTNPINLALLLICMRKRLLLGSLIKVSFNDSEKSMSMLQDSNLH